MPFIRLHQRIKKLWPEHETTQTDGQKNIVLDALSHSDTPMCQLWHVYRKDQRIYGLGTNQCYKTYNFDLEVKVQGNIQVMKVCNASSYGLVIHPCAKWYVYIKEQRHYGPTRICTDRWMDADRYTCRVLDTSSHGDTPMHQIWYIYGKEQRS